MSGASTIGRTLCAGRQNVQLNRCNRWGVVWARVEASFSYRDFFRVTSRKSVSALCKFREIPGSCANRWETWHLVPNRSEGTRATIPDENFASPDSRRFLGIAAVTNGPRQRHPVATHSAPQRLNAAKGLLTIRLGGARTIRLRASAPRSSSSEVSAVGARKAQRQA